MKKISVCLALAIIMSCSPADPVKDDTPQFESKTIILEKKEVTVKEEQKKEPEPVKSVEVKTGWEDPDTYTVRVSGPDENRAIKNARHQILKDIVSVRLRNQSPFTDISKIQEEFEIPLKQGEIIRKNEISEGIEIFYRIRDKDLKKKFERK